MDRKRIRLFGSSPLATAAMVVYFGVGYVLIKLFWPDSDVGLWMLVAVGMVVYISILWRQRDSG